MEVIDFSRLFYEISDEKYCVIKARNIEEYKAGDDIDLFCYPIVQFTRKLISVISKMLTNERSIVVRELNEYHFHVDILENEEIVFRIDLYGAIPEYKRVKIKPGFFEHAIEHSTKEYITDTQIYYYKCSDMDEFLIRYVEYVEYFYIRPDKMKHLDYILSKFDDDKRLKDDFMKFLYYYTAIPD